ncbi:Gp19/Gp15/Gp42 family protein [Agromyces sp. NPDC127015]|uniref:Gp19/Gp15/Gp42 family protein n=1 Tax=Agromyces sp. NPDC127015 TaxID=3347108 RepID=UPI003651427B
MPEELTPPLAGTADIEGALLRPLTSAEAPYAAGLLARAEAILMVRIPVLRVRADEFPGFEVLVKGVEGEMVARVFRNPEGLFREEQGNYSYQLDRAVASGRLAVLDDELQVLGVPTKGLIGSAAGAMDGYAVARYGQARPDLQFQYGWPGAPT